MNKNQKILCKDLRDETGYGISYCKKALISYNWDYQLAKENINNFVWKGKLANPYEMSLKEEEKLFEDLSNQIKKELNKRKN